MVKIVTTYIKFTFKIHLLLNWVCAPKLTLISSRSGDLHLQEKGGKGALRSTEPFLGDLCSGGLRASCTLRRMNFLISLRQNRPQKAKSLGIMSSCVTKH